MPEVKPAMLVLSLFPLLIAPQDQGLKFVVFQIDGVGHEYGFAHWNGICFDEVDPRAHVVKWAELPRPQIVL
jgi:hypothetical protein